MKMSSFQRNQVLDRLVEAQAKLAAETDPKKIEELKKKIEELEKTYKLVQIANY